MTVPRLLVMTDRHRSAASGRDLPDTVAMAVEGGAPAVVFREKDLTGETRHRLAVEVAGVTLAGGARFFVASDPVLAHRTGATGLHLASVDPPYPQDAVLVGRSCHDAQQVRDATGLDYVTVSPVAATASKPGYGPALGVQGLASLVRVAGDLPVLALGGVVPGSVGMWLQAGAHGVAVLGAVMGAEDPRAVVRRLVDELGQEMP